jgi:hypothetical protein
MAEIVVGVALWSITRIICEVIKQNNQSSQRFKCTLRRKYTDERGRSYEEEETVEFDSQEEMVKYAREYSVRSSVAIEYKRLALK